LAQANSKLAAEAAAALADRLQRERPAAAADDDAFIEAAWRHVLAARPTEEERAECRAALAAFRAAAPPGDAAEATRRARRRLALALVNHNDFIAVR
jgi:hypothetical protein